MRVYTQGLPDATFRNQKYTFDFIMTDRYIFIPNESIGRDCLGEPLFLEQAGWLNKFNKEGCIYQGDGCWLCTNEAVFSKICRLIYQVEHFRGVYSLLLYDDKNNLKEIQEVYIGKEQLIEKISLKTYRYDDKESLISQKEAILPVFTQYFYPEQSSYLQITLADEVAKTLLINLVDNTFSYK